MKKIVFVLGVLLLFSYSVSAQTTLVSEDFDGATVSFTSSSASGLANWAVSSNLQVSGSNSDTARVRNSDTLFLESPVFDATNYTFLSLQFEQICKIDFFDKAQIQISTNNGQSWTTLNSTHYQGSGFFTSNSFSAVSYSIWNIGQPGATPTNSWWQTENFNLTPFVGNAQTKIRFVLIDGDNNGPVNNYGWVLDDIQVVGAPCELIPPSVTLTGTIFQGQVYFNGPYTIQADITDASGVDSASLTYSINQSPPVNVNMSRSGNTFSASIPSASVGDTVCYTIFAQDSTTCVNTTVFPSAGSCVEFIISNSPPPNCVGTPIFSYPSVEDFSSFTPGNGSSTVGTLRNNWVNESNDTHDWFVLDRATGSGGTGPTSGHTSTDLNYMYVEASGSFSNKIAILNTPCYDLTNLVAPKFSFWYHMSGLDMGRLHVDIYFGGQWVNDVIPPFIGDQGTNWNFREVSLQQYAGNIIQLRFRAFTGNGFRSDIAIDDISMVEPLANDLYLDNIITPNVTGCNGSPNDFVTLKVKNLGSSVRDTIPLAYRVNNGAVIRDTSFFALNPGDSTNHTFQQTVNLSAAGTYSFDFWIEPQSEQNRDNDSIFNYAISTSPVTISFPDTTNFDNFTPGTPGTLLNGWSNGTYDDIDWFVSTGGTPSVGTGPTGDNTTGSGNYLYTEASGNNNSSAELYSKCYDLRFMNQAELEFYFHMEGAAMGELHLDIQVNSITIRDIMPALIGPQATGWNGQVVNLSQFNGIVKLIFRGITGNGFTSDIAIDDIIVRDANPVGLNESNQDVAKWSFYPNPASDKIYFTSSEVGGNVVIRNSLGQELLNQGVSNSIEQIDVSYLPKGIFFIEYTNNGNRETKKLILN